MKRRRGKGEGEGSRNIEKEELGVMEETNEEIRSDQ